MLGEHEGAGQSYDAGTFGVLGVLDSACVPSYERSSRAYPTITTLVDMLGCVEDSELWWGSDV